MANRIQIRRDTAANWTRVNPILSDGEPGLETDTNKVKYGDGTTAWASLDYASGGGGFTDVDGLVTFPGDLLIGTLWPEDPMPGGDKESVVWAKDDTEYLGLWWGGDQTYPDEGYGPVAGIMIGAYDGMTDDFTNDPSPADTNITSAINDSVGETLEWRFDRDGILTFPDSGLTIGTVAGEVQIGTISTDLNILRSGVDGVEIFENEVGFYAGNNKRAQVVPTGLEIISGNLTLPAGGEIHSSSGTGAVAVQSNDGSNNFNWNFTTHGSITMPELLSGAQGYGSLDANNNKIALTTSDTVNFAGFSGMILVNTHNGGGVSLYLCGGGSGSAIAIGDSKTGNSVGSMAFNAGIAGYTFTADETGDHVFFAIRTRTGG